MKLCMKCVQSKSLDCFSNKLNGTQHLCKECASEYHKNWYAKVTGRTLSQMGKNNRTKMSGKIIDGKKLCSRCQQWKLMKYFNKLGPWCSKCHKLYGRIRNIIARMEFILAYGGMCSCCGETCIDFLTVEHIRYKGHNLIYGNGAGFINKLKELGWPKGYTVLCYNCNCSTKQGRPCIHNEEKYKIYQEEFDLFLVNTNKLEIYNKLVDKLNNRKIKDIELEIAAKDDE